MTAFDEAREEGIEAHRPALYHYCRRLTGDPFDAEDLHQETVLRAFSKLSERFEPVAHPKAYLFRMATNLWIDWQRRAAWYASDPPADIPAPDPPPQGRENQVGDVARLATEEDTVVRIDFYYFSPELLQDICEPLGRPFRNNGYAVFDRGWWNREQKGFDVRFEEAPAPKNRAG